MNMGLFYRYPGDDYVDVLGNDCYRMLGQCMVNKFAWIFHELSNYAVEKGKLFALTEVSIDKCWIRDW